MTTSVETTNVEKTTSPDSEVITISYPTRLSGIVNLFSVRFTVGILIGALPTGIDAGL